MGNYPPRVEIILPGFGGTSALSRGATLAARWLHESQPISDHPVGLGFPHRPGRYRSGRSLFSSPGCWSCRGMERFLTRGQNLILPGCGGTSTLARDATLAARWLHEPRPISNQPVVLGFPHPAGRYRLRGSPFSSPGSWSCIDKQGFMIRGWDIILPGWDGTSALARGATLIARWLHEPQPIRNHPVGLGFPQRAGRYRPG